MSTDAIVAAVVAVVAGVSGVPSNNVHEEQPIAFERDLAAVQRIDGGKVHFWQVRLEESPPAGGVGYVELRHRVVIEGYLGVARDESSSGEPSDKLARRLLSAVTSAVAAAANITLSGAALGSENVTPEPLRIVTVKVDGEAHPAHRMALSYTVVEDA